MLESFLIKLQACKLIEKRLQHWCFPLHVRKFLKPYFEKQRTAASDYSFTSASYLSPYNYKEKQLSLFGEKNLNRN